MKKISKILFLTLITFLLVTFTGCLADDEIPAGKMFSIRFDTDGGSIVETITGEYNSPVIAPEDPTKEGHTFMGWNKAIPTKMPAKNVVISALWKINQYKLTFDSNGGSEVKSMVLDYGKKIGKIEPPVREGYIFMGWDKELPIYMPDEDIHFVAKWEIRKEIITFNTNGGTEIPYQNLEYGSKVTRPADPEKVGYTFTGWTLDGAPFDFDSYIVKGDATIEANWQINEYTISFDTDGGSLINDIKQDYNTEITAPAEPTKVGYTFVGWDKEIPANMPAENVEIKALWKINQYTVSFDVDGVVTKVTGDYNTAVTKVADPEKVGYTFDGWDKAVPSVFPAEDVTVKATWKINQYTISFDTDGGSLIDNIKQDYNTNITAPADPTKVGYTFVGWDKEIPAYMPAENVEIKALWKINQYTVSFDVDGVVTKVTGDYNTAVTPVADPEKVGYTFDGWDKAVPSVFGAEDVTVKATWKINQYTVSFDVDGVVTKVTGDYNTAVTPIADPEKVGYTFTGWDTAVPSVFPAEDVTVKATWKINEYTISFDVDGVVTKVTGDYNTVVTPIADPEKVGYTFTGWDKAVPSVFPAEDVTIKATWKINQYTVSFDVDGVVTKVTGDYNTAVTPIADPEKVGHTFAGWDKAVPSVFPAEDVTVKATWTVNTYKVTYNFTGAELTIYGYNSYEEVVADFEADLKSFGISGYSHWSFSSKFYRVFSETNGKWDWLLRYFIEVSDANYSGVKADDVFQSLLDRNESTDYSIFNKDNGEGGYGYFFSTEIYAFTISTQKSVYSGSLKSADYSSLAIRNKIMDFVPRNVYQDKYEVEYKYNDEVETLNNPVQPGYGFTSWGATVPATMPAEDLVFNAVFTPRDYTLTFMSGSDVLSTSTVAYGASISAPADPVKVGYTFKGWDKVVPTTMPADDLVINAVWEVITYTITYDYDGGRVGSYYATRDEMVADFLKDFNTFAGKSYTTVAAYWGDSNKSNFWRNAEMHAKWSWIFEALMPYAKAQGQVTTYLEGMLASPMSLSGYATQNVAIYLLGIDVATWNSTYKATYGGLSSSYTTINCTSEDVQNTYLNYDGNARKYTVEDEVVLLDLVKDAHDFIGWYNGETKVTSIAKGTTGNINLVAKFEARPVRLTFVSYDGIEIKTIEDVPGSFVSAPEDPTRVGYNFLGWDQEVPSVMPSTDTVVTAEWSLIHYTISYDFDGGIEFNVYQDFNAMAADLLADYNAYAGKTYTKDTVPTDAWSYINLHTFFYSTVNGDKMNIKWAWLATALGEVGGASNKKYCKALLDYTDAASYKAPAAHTNQGIYAVSYEFRAVMRQADVSTNSNFLTSDYSNVDTQNALMKYAPKGTYTIEDTFTIHETSKEGYNFLGWYNGDQLVETITAGTYGNLSLVAKYDQVKSFFIGEKGYLTLSEALAAAESGDVINVVPGTYEGATISVPNITINGANADINPNTGTRTDESIFTTDLVIAADNVTINGIQTTGTARILGGSAGCANTVIKNVWSKGSTINSGNNNIAPFYFSTTSESVVYTNISLINVRMSDRTDGRQMAAMFDHVNGLTIKDSYFIAKQGTYNDAVKFGQNGTYGVKGNITITGSHFEGFMQYVLWFMKYQEGTYTLENNTFKNNGVTASSHCAARFAAYNGADDGVSTINMIGNTVDNSYMILRIDATTGRNATTQPVKVNNNKLLNCKADYYVKNSNAYNIDALNNTYDVTPTDSKFLNATWKSE